jgi:hypothetical protein
MSRSKELEVKKLSEMLALLEKTADLILKTTPSRDKQARKIDELETTTKNSTTDIEVSLEGSLR